MSDERGFTIVEVMVAAMILIVGLLGTLRLVESSNAATVATTKRESATNLARQVVEASRLLPFQLLTPSSITTQLQAKPGLAPTTGDGQWTIQRRGNLFDISATVCDVDDPTDGAGSHATGTFCPGGTSAGTADTNPQNYKRIQVDVSWTEAGLVKHVYESSVVNNPGSAGAPTVASMTANENTAGGAAISAGSGTATITSTSVAAIFFTVTTAGNEAVALPWAVDGSVQGNAAQAVSPFTFTWSLSGVSDGAYTVSAWGVDDTGSQGEAQALTVNLNRYAPSAPTGLNAGRNGSAVDLEWRAVGEKDVVGYRVYRQAAGGDVRVCQLQSDVTCQDTSPPATNPQTYYVVAVDLDSSGNYREGAQSTTASTTATNRPPNAPSALTATSSGGNTTLTWTAASPLDPDGGSLAFYRIYRDGQTYADRYSRTATTTWTDTATGGLAHDYYVTAVDPQLGESAPLGPVNR